MTNLTSTSNNVLAFVPKLSVVSNRENLESISGAKIITLDDNLRQRASAKKYIPPCWTLSPTDLTAA